MKFGILVNEGPFQHQASDSAYHFATAAIEQGHQVYRVFFYHDGVNNGTRLASPPTDDRQITARWTRLAKDHGVDLVVCTAAAQRRGIADDSAARRVDAPTGNLAEGFRVAGLSLLMEAGLETDRMLVFGD